MNPLFQLKNRFSPFGSFSPRSLVALLFCGVAYLTVTGALPAFFNPEAPAKVSQRTLTFAERVAYQRAIEDVYWRHRIWPKENPNPKPSLDVVMSQAQLENKVARYLRNSQELEDYWQQPIAAKQLQAEMDRMAQHSRQPEVLRELFEALGNDSFVIAECLARPLLAERLLTHSVSEQVKQTSRTDERVGAATSDYHLPLVSDAGGCTDDTWTPISTANAPSGRTGHTAVWTGSEMIIWGGLSSSGTRSNSGSRYNPALDSWTPTSATNAPTGRSGHTAVWTGSEMIIWGGYGDGALLNTGGRYNPATDVWTDTDISSAPSARDYHTAIWTGSEMIIWGGANAIYFPPEALGSGGRYNPVTNSWTGMSGYSERFRHTAVWTGTEMIVWGGANFDFRGLPVALGDGGKYNPSTDSWTATGSTNAPASRQWHTAVWTGSEMIVWGGRGDASNDFNIGGRYHPSTDSWTATSTTNAPTARSLHTAVWTGSEMIVWGGDDFPNFFHTGGRYNPDTNTWTATSLTHAPSVRYDHTAVWTGSEMIAWGGRGPNNVLNNGGRYCANVSPQLGNISTRAFVQTGDDVMIGGFIVQGTEPKRVIIRAIGPELTQHGVPNALANPTLELHDGTGALIASNNNWATTIIGGIITANQVRDIQASGYAPGDGLESAIIADLPPGNYTAIMRSVNNMTGVGLVEVYALSRDASSILGNISTRSFVQTGDNVMIGGFIVQGTQPKRVIVRAIGPSLIQYGVPNVLVDPTLELHDGTGALIASNDNWVTTIIGGIITTNQVRQIQASGHAPRDGRESAIIAALPEGNYTAIVRGVNNTTGVGLVEVYDLGE